MRLRLIAIVCLGALAAAAAEPGVRRLKRNVYRLASDKMKGRVAGSPELESAAEFLAGRMWQLGLQPASAGGWFQAVPVNAATAKSIGITIESGASKFELTNGNVQPMAARQADLSGAGVVKVSRENARQLKAEDVKGKVVLATSFAGMVRVGPPAAVIVAAAGERRNMGMMPSVTPVLQGTAPGPPFPVLLSADEALSKWVDGLPGGAVADAKVTGGMKAEDRVFLLRNVAGILRGSDPALRDSYVMVSAHYDHIGEVATGTDRIRNGANDDASGVATMLAVAKILSSGKVKPKRSVIFVAWTGEEAGGLGSQWYARHPLVPLSRTVAMINLEQTGRYDGEGGAGKGKAFVTGYGYSDVGKMLTEGAKAAGFEINAGPDAFFNRSDNVFLARAGVPAHTVGSSLEFPDYHSVSDSADKLDYENMAAMSRGIAAGVLAIANAAEEPKWSETVEAAAPYRKARAAQASR